MERTSSAGNVYLGIYNADALRVDADLAPIRTIETYAPNFLGSDSTTHIIDSGSLPFAHTREIVVVLSAAVNFSYNLANLSLTPIPKMTAS